MTHRIPHPPLERLPWILASPGESTDPLGYLGPNWYASVMGTGIVANAGATLPVQVTGLHTFSGSSRTRVDPR